MTPAHDLWGFFDGNRAAAKAVSELRGKGVQFTLYAPFMTHELEHALAPRVSPVRLFVLAGGLAGGVAGFALTAYSALRWGQIVGGQPILAFPPFLVIAFELLLLFGAIAALLGFLLLSRLLVSRRSPGYVAELSEDRFAVRIAATADDLARSREILEQTGAVEVRDNSPSTAAIPKEGDDA